MHRIYVFMELKIPNGWTSYLFEFVFTLNFWRDLEEQGSYYENRKPDLFAF